MLDRTYAISAILAYPWSTGSNGLKRAINLAYPVGYRGIQASPLRGWDYDLASRSNGAVISVEGSFGSVSFWNNLRRMDFINFTLFDREEMPSVFPHAIRCSHEFDRGTVVEVYPDLSTDPYEYVYHCENGEVDGVCIDTNHLCRLGRDGQKIDWRNFLHVMPARFIKLMHVQPVVDYDDFIAGKDCLTAEVLRVLRHKGVISPAVIEVRKPSFFLTGYKKRRILLGALLRNARRHLDRF